MKGPKGAEPTIRGWINPRTGELLKSQKISQSAIDKWHGIEPNVYPAQVIETITQQASLADHIDAYNETVEGKWDAAENDMLQGMTKTQLEDYGRQHGIELDRRFLKSKMIAELKQHLS